MHQRPFHHTTTSALTIEALTDTSVIDDQVAALHRQPKAMVHGTLSVCAVTAPTPQATIITTY